MNFLHCNFYWYTMMLQTVLCLLLVAEVTVGEMADCSPCHCYVDDNDKSIGANCYSTISSSSETISTILPNIPKNVNVLLFPNRPFKILENNTFDSCFNLTKLSFNHNQINRIELDAFRNLTKLGMLWLEFNQLSSLPEGVFRDLKQLLHIYLRRNKLTSLPQNLFSDLPLLKTIDLSSNLLNSISSACFNKLPLLRKVHLEDNSLQTLHPNVVDNPTMLQLFNLNDNPWRCDQQLCPIMDAISTSEFYEMLCSKPKQFEYKRWVEFVEHFHPNFTTTDYESVKEGLTVRLQCQHCTPSRLVWTFHGQRIARQHHIMIQETAMMSSLVLPNVTATDAGKYGCQVVDCFSCIVAETHLGVVIRNSKPFAFDDSISNETICSSAVSVRDHSKCATTITALIVIIVILIVACILSFFRQTIQRRITSKNLHPVKMSKNQNEEMSAAYSYPSLGSTANIYDNIS